MLLNLSILMTKKAPFKERNLVAQVALPLPSRRTFDYAFTSAGDLVQEGIRVRVPLKAREVTGIVLAIKKSSTK